MPQEGSLWASLSSPFPKPRGPKVAHRSATFEVEALGEWRTSTLNSFGAGSGANLCVSSNESLKADCLSKNAAVSAKLRESGPLTRTASGYNFGDVVMILDNRIVSVSTVSMGYERLYQSARLRSCQVFFGVSNQQDPADAFVIMDMLGRVQPDLVIELGTAGGGSAFFYARTMREYNPSARILTIDPASGPGAVPLKQWNDQEVEIHCPHCMHSTETSVWGPNGSIRFFHGFPDSPEAIAIATEAASRANTVMVIEDSDHIYDHVKANLDAYHHFVTPGSYFLVQDTRLGGPHQALRNFLESASGACYDIDKRWEYFIYSQHFDGFLRRRNNCTT